MTKDEIKELDYVLNAMSYYHNLSGADIPQERKQRIADQYTTAIMKLRAVIHPHRNKILAEEAGFAPDINVGHTQQSI